MHQLHLVLLFSPYVNNYSPFQNNNLSILKFRRKKLLILNFLIFQQRFTNNMIYHGLMKVWMISLNVPLFQD